jgi:hypothetical protein
MTGTSAVPEVPGSIDIDSTFLPVGQMRQIDRVTAIDGTLIEGEMDLGPDPLGLPSP